MINNRQVVLAEFSRYLVVGGLAFACDFLAYWILIESLGVHYLVANVFGFCLGLTMNYLLSIFWVFSQRASASVKREFLLFTGIGLFNLALGELCLWIMVALGDIHHITAKIVVTGLVFLSNFCLRKVMLFHVRSA